MHDSSATVEEIFRRNGYRLCNRSTCDNFVRIAERATCLECHPVDEFGDWIDSIIDGTWLGTER